MATPKGPTQRVARLLLHADPRLYWWVLGGLVVTTTASALTSRELQLQLPVISSASLAVASGGLISRSGTAVKAAALGGSLCSFWLLLITAILQPCIGPFPVALPLAGVSLLISMPQAVAQIAQRGIAERICLIFGFLAWLFAFALINSVSLGSSVGAGFLVATYIGFTLPVIGGTIGLMLLIPLARQLGPIARGH